SAITNVGTPVPDGTTINFTASPGGIDPFAATTDGAATVTFTAPTVTVNTSASITASVAGVPGSTTVSITAAPAPAATQTLDSFTDISTAPAVPATVPMANIASTATNGGVALTSTQVTIGGAPTPVLPADVGAIRVLWNAVQVGIVNSPVSLANVNIPLVGAGLGNGTLTYELDLLGTATGMDFDLTVNSVTGNTTDSIPLPAATVNQTAP
ncbi:MAG: hypothetical protein JSV13_09065, partial [Nitrospiraceae bacterium]